MKGLVFIFGLFFFILSIVPCYCEELGVDPCGQTEHIQKSENQQHNTPGDTACTPFCHCSNFHHPNFFEDIDINTHIAIIAMPRYTFYTENFSLSVISGFWRPPQLS